MGEVCEVSEERGQERLRLKPRSSTGLGLLHHIRGVVRASLPLGTVHIFCRVILCHGNCPGHVGCFSSVPGLYPLDASSTPPPSCDNQKCLPVFSNVLGVDILVQWHPSRQSEGQKAQSEQPAGPGVDDLVLCVEEFGTRERCGGLCFLGRQPGTYG